MTNKNALIVTLKKNIISITANLKFYKTIITKPRSLNLRLFKV